MNFTSSAVSRRNLYRTAKRVLYAQTVPRWRGPKHLLRRTIREFLRGKKRSYLLRLVRQHAFTLAVAATLLTGATAYASPPIELSDIAMNANAGGFVINGTDEEDIAGYSVSGAGDINGDGLDDLVIGARKGVLSSAGQSYVVFGKENGDSVELADVYAGIGGFVIKAIDSDDRSGYSVSGAGDVNGDGLDDLIVGGGAADPNGMQSAGESYVVFGKSSGTAVELTDVYAGTGGFVIKGIDEDDFSGYSVSGAGDVNGDGLADLVVGASGADPNGAYEAGESYVVFGKSSGTPVELADVYAGTSGFVIKGIDEDDWSGFSVSGAGDVNGDGLDDLVVGASNAEESYVVFGKSSGTTVELSDVYVGTGGFVIKGINWNDHSGWSVSGAGDVNGDGLVDLLIGALGGDPNGESWAGESYVVFGKSGGTAVELADVYTGTGGFVLKGVDEDDLAGHSVSGAGDVNGDGLDDLIVGALGGDPNGTLSAGESYVVFSPETPPAAPATVWSDFAFAGWLPLGTETSPFDNLQDSIDKVADGGAINIKGDTSISSSGETLTISKPMTINAVGGTVTIGEP